MRTKNADTKTAIIDYIENKFFSTGTTPSVREIAEAVGISKSSVSNYLADMSKDGLLENKGCYRGVRTRLMRKVSQGIVNVPVVGRIACGTPFLAEENIETYLPLPQEVLGSGEFFILQASGKSMINAGVDDGDYVIVRRQEVAEQGQIVVALIGEEATLKRYYLDEGNKRVRLHPENDEMKDMYYKHIDVQGIAIKVLKNLV